MKNRNKFLSGVVSFAALATSSFGALNSPFESLPAETIAAFRFDNSPETLEQYVDNTKMGQLLFSDEKIAEYKAFIEKLIESEEAGGNFIQKLGEVGLELDDLYEMATSHIGGAVVDHPVPGHLSMPTILIWAEMSDGVAERAFQAVLEGSAENEGIERTDLELPGGPGARIRKIADGSSFLVAQIENRFLFAIGNVREEIADMEAARVFEEAELEALGLFMTAQLEGGGEFLSDFYADAGVSSVRPSYETRLELLGDVQRLLDFVPPQNRQMVESLDINDFNKIGVWSGFVDMEERSILYFGAPAPRKGVAKLFENEFFEFQPPAWVPSSVNTYTAASFDMMKLYDFALETAKKFAPPEQVEQQLGMVNAQLQMSLQTDIETLLSSFGTRIHMLEYPIELVSVDVGEGNNVDIPQSSQAIVMDFTRPEILQAGMAMIGAMAQNPASGFELVDEMGFSGVRMKQPGQGSVTIAHGLGKLVFAIGTDNTSSRIFSTLTTVPEGEDALAGNSELRDYLSEAGVKQGTMFSYSQGDKVLKNLVPVFQTLSDTMSTAAGEDAGELVDDLVNLLPKEEELEGLLGITFSRMYYNDAGIVLEGINQYK
ncbi:hypothetical protein [Pelagicoccus mobilis]|uniref:DUF3352 domain-containing protein n=1 Tax=Pelagicoccus mobilis TaxID=415221 RepID=A0A934S0T4_9BACT|nr:hypothetical protein [Pelagicoccus mobilis]MBK1879105.1 hypothetical protein [Pelagicoccus mobilis]